MRPVAVCWQSIMGGHSGHGDFNFASLALEGGLAASSLGELEGAMGGVKDWDWIVEQAWMIATAAWEVGLRACT